MAGRFGNGRLKAMFRSMEDDQREPKVPRVQEARKSDKVAGIQAQTDVEPQNVWVTNSKPKYNFTSIKEGNPLTLEWEWNLAVMRTKEDPEMELGIQRLFRNKFGEIIVPEGNVAHIKTATWLLEKEEDQPITRLVFRIKEEDMVTTAARL